jgi:hypothetical protein
LDELVVSQGAATKEETESQRFMNGLRQLIASNPSLFLEKGRPRNDNTFPVIGKWMPDGMWLMPEKTLAEMAKFKVFTQIPTAESMTAALDRDKLLMHQVSGKTIHKQWLASIGGTKLRGWYVIMDTPEMTAKKDAADRKAAEEAMAGNQEKTQQETPSEPENGKTEASGTAPVTAKQEHAAPSYQITRVTSQNGPIGEKKSFVSEEDKHIKSSLGDTQNTGNLVTPIDKDTTVAVITVTNELPVSNQDSLKSDTLDTTKRLPVPHNKDEPTPAKKVSATTKEKVRIIKQDGYRTQIPSADNPDKFIDHLYSFGEVVEQEHWKACDLIKRGIAEVAEAQT